MAVDKGRFRTNQEEYFLPEDSNDVAPVNKNSDGVFIAVVALGFVAAASLGTILSFAW